jgi:hypothetical protein
MPQPLASLKPMTAGKPVILTLYFQHIDRFLQPNGLNGIHESFDLARVVLPEERPTNLVDGNIFYAHGELTHLKSLVTFQI